ncbi:MAG: tetratricopeptide repeat protein [Bacteroidota bacterium]|nr:tetratricopeptide repeat protein [Bacteroidota bacterium]
MKKVKVITICLLCQVAVFAQWNTERILTIGQNALYFEDYVLSIQYFNQVIKIKPYLAEPYLNRAIAKIQLGDYQGADQDCSEAIKINPFLPQAYYARGFARKKMNFFTEATADFTKALEFSPNSLYLLMNRMDARDRNKDYTGALSDLDTYLKLSPKTYSLYYEKGRIQLELKDTLAAEKTFNQFIQKDSINFLGWSARAILRMEKNDKDGALKDYTEAIKRNTTYEGDYINRGILNVEKKNYNQALSDYNNAIKIDKNNALAYYNRGLLRANLGDNNNALTDLTTVLKLDSSNNEALLRKAMLESTIGDFRNSIKDYKAIIGKFHYFIPAYVGIAEAEESLGNKKVSFQYRQLAYNIEKNKDYINRKNKETIQATNKTAKNVQQSTTGRKTDLFNRFAAQDIENTETESKYSEETRGAVQDKYTDVINERNFVLTYYAKADEIRRTNIYYPALDEYNKEKKLSSVLKITNNELSLTAELVNGHFEAINNISNQLAKDNNDPDIYFNRSLEFAMVQDFNSAIEDLNKAILLRPNFMLAYFCRANIRFKLLDYIKNTADQTNKGVVESTKEKNKKISVEKQSMFDVEMMMRDYDKVNALNPDFSFAYFNKANVLCTQKDFSTAISNYTKSIEIDPEFAEAYFNRGLTYLFVGEDAKGLADLSKAGELGIYKSYNLIQRFKK